MTKQLGSLVAILLLALTVDLVAASPEFHFALTKSTPEANSEVSSPDEIRLWFSQVPQEGSMSVRLLDADGELVETGDAARDASDGRVWSVAIGHRLAPGPYTVSWRGIGDDGHVVRGEVPFAVAAR